MKRIISIVLFLVLVLSGCGTDERYRVDIADSIDAELKVVFKQNEYRLTMHRSLPMVYSFTMLDYEFNETVININTQSFELSTDYTSFETQNLPKSSFFFIFTSVLDYISKPDIDLNSVKFKDGYVTVSGNNGYEDFIICVNESTKLPISLDIPSEDLTVNFLYNTTSS